MLSYSRVLLKLSGEFFQSSDSSLCSDKISFLVSEIDKLYKKKIQICIVIGGGNFFRGALKSNKILSRSTADYIGMMATIMNGIALQDAFSYYKIPSITMSGLYTAGLCSPFNLQRARKKLEKGKILIFSGGTGNPLFTTDTAASLRAIEMGCDVLYKVTKVDGVYSKDPIKYKDAQHFPRLTYDEVLSKKLNVMDLTSIVMCKENNLPIVIGKLNKDNSLTNILDGTAQHTVIS